MPAWQGFNTRKKRMKTNHVEYKLRAESLSQVNLIRTLLQSWLLRVQIEQVIILPNGELVMPVDVQFEFTIHSDGPDLGEIQWLIDAMDGCKVAAETVAPVQHYTGNRVPLNVTDSLPRRPEGSHRFDAWNAAAYWIEAAEGESVRAREVAKHLMSKLSK